MMIQLTTLAGHRDRFTNSNRTANSRHRLWRACDWRLRGQTATEFKLAPTIT
jgi:hypothetical protein